MRSSGPVLRGASAVAGLVLAPELALLLALALAPANAMAEDVRPRPIAFAVFPFEGFGLPKALEMAPVSAFEIVSNGLRAAGHSVMEPPLTLRDMMVALDCASLDGGCAVKMGANLSVRRVVVGKLEGSAGHVVLKIRAFDCSDGRMFFSADDAVGTERDGVAPAARGLAGALDLAASGRAAADVPRGGAGPGAASIGLLAAGGAVLAGGIAAAVGLGATVAAIRTYDRPYAIEEVNAIESLTTSGRRLAFASLVLSGVGVAALGTGIVLAVVGGKRDRAAAVALALAPGGGPIVLIRWRAGGAP